MELEKRHRAHMARLDLDSRQSAILDGQAHNARALWNLLHEYYTFRQGRFATLKDMRRGDPAGAQGRRLVEGPACASFPSCAQDLSAGVGELLQPRPSR
ncbi:hypothetical protein [Nonomuraea sp. NPDC049625]|uniref:hypothetical protein n=1 Tax=Nonomuraea sp. NPDC049625 TaxID=3155775 RepID=UPI003425E3F2